jgi:hypothetical protein
MGLLLMGLYILLSIANVPIAPKSFEDPPL